VTARIAAGLAVAALALLAALPASGQDGETLDLDRVRALRDQGKTHFDESANVDLSPKKRNEQRKKAFVILTEVFEILDKWCDAHPEDGERLEDLIVEVHQMRYWLRKESPVGLLEGDDDNVRKGKPEDWPDKPPPDLKEPAKAPAGAPQAPADPPPPKPKPSPLDAAREYEKDHPFDGPGALEQWLEVLASLEDPVSPEYAEALGRVAVLSEQLKEAYRRLRNEDPDSIDAGRDSGREAAIATRLAEGLEAAETAARLQAADQLAALGYTPASRQILIAAGRESDKAVRERLFLALVRLGGRRTCENLSRFARERDPALPLDAIRALTALGKRGPVQARYAGLSLGEYARKGKAPVVGDEAVEALGTFGAAGVQGLVLAAETKRPDLELAVLQALGATGVAAAAPSLCERLLLKANEKARDLAVRQLEKLGETAIPALIDALGSRKTRRYAAVALYEITGQAFGEDARAWSKWWRAKR